MNPKPFALALVCLAAVADPAAAASPIANLITTYSQSGPSQMSWTTCGSTSTSEGCFGSGSLGGLSNACAVMEGPSKVVKRTALVYEAARALYVMNAGDAANKATLNVYRKTDTLANGYDTTVITLSSQIALPLVGGPGVACSMAGNAAALFLGTDKSTAAASVTIATLAVAQVGGFSPPMTVSRITASDGGFVAVMFGSGVNTGFYEFGPNGALAFDGGGGAIVANETQAVQLFPSAAATPPQLVTHSYVHATGVE